MTPAKTDPGLTDIWFVGLDIDEKMFLQFESLLSDDERARADRFQFAIHRRRFVARRGALRSVLSGYLLQDARRIEFSYGAFGKPQLVGEYQLAFNVSKSEDLAVIAVCEGGPIGVDMEKIQSMPDAMSIARSYFTQREFDWLMSQPEADRISSFFRCWTLKEAYTKADGRGLTFPLNAFDVVSQTVDGRFEACTTIDEFSFQLFAPSAEFVCCVCRRGFSAGNIRIFEFDSQLLPHQ
jgi:4'-phosphopantetheinyl transferase